MTDQGILEARFFHRPGDGQTLNTPILIVGGSTAAYAAALGALQAGSQACLVQPQLVLGGQFTAQGLPASDDGKLLTPSELIPLEERDPQQLLNSECFALSRSQRQFRQCQRHHQPVANQVLKNPGGSWVSHLSVTPVVASDCLNQVIKPYLEQGLLTIIPWAVPTQVLTQDEPQQFRRIIGVRFVDQQTQNQFTVMANVTIEATDLGDLLELGNLPARVGQESRSQTQEAVLPTDPRPDCQQAITFCAIAERSSQVSSPLPPPPGYDVAPWLLSKAFTSVFWFQKDEQWQQQGFYDPDGMFRYRRLLRSQDSDDVCVGDVTVLNWATSPLGIDDGPPDPHAPLGCGNDYPFGGLLGVSPTARQQQTQRARDRTQAYLYYLQTHGFPELKSRGDLTWTEDGIALEPYIREARRGIALTTIRHEDVAAKFFPSQVRARTFEDSVGIGQYHYLDVHPNHAPGHVQLEDGYDALPFTLPLRALIPIDTNSLILSSKSIGTTHITNAAYRMHPMEWAIGEAGGHLAVFALEQGVEIRDISQDVCLRRQFQHRLAQQGMPLVWFNDLGHDDPDFAAIHVLSATGLLPIESLQTLNFNPDQPISRASFCRALAQVLGWMQNGKRFSPSTFVDVPPTHVSFSAIEGLVRQGMTISAGPDRFEPEQPMTQQQARQLIGQLQLEHLSVISSPMNLDNMTRRQAARLLYAIWIHFNTSMPDH